MNRVPTGRGALEPCLLDYQHSPGKYALAGKRPALLFASITQVLQLASGRTSEGLDEPAPAPAVQSAACFFIRSALLFPNADHYALLGLERGADTAAVKDRFRLMMRLVHPDFAGSPAAAGSWPADAASRLNRAYEVLSSPTQRRAYDEQLAPPSPARQAASDARPPRSFKAAAPHSPNRDAHRILKRLATGFGAAGAFAALAVLYAGMAGEKESLVQRAIGARATAIVASLADAPAPAAAASELRAPAALLVAPAASAAVAAVQASAIASAPDIALAAASSPAAAVAAPPLVASSATTAAADPPAAPAPTPPVVAAPAAPSPPEKGWQPAEAPAAKLPANPGVTLSEVHPLLSRLLQRMESGSGSQVVALLEPSARSAPAAQDLLRDFDNLVDGGYPVKVSNVQFKAEPKEGRLLVTGHVMLQVGSPPQGGKPFTVQAEFVLRDGTVVMTRLARAQGH